MVRGQARISFWASGIKRQTAAKAQASRPSLGHTVCFLAQISRWLWGGPSELSEYPKG
jgi:hypothetical protein